VIVLVALGAILLVIGLAFGLRSEEPSYAGRRLSFWIGQLPSTLVMTNGIVRMHPGEYTNVAEADADQARIDRLAAVTREALRNITSQALPVLLHRLETKDDSPAGAKFIEWRVKLKMLKPTLQTARSGAFMRGQALTAILELGDRAAPIVPDLLKLARSNDPGIRRSARYALESLAPVKLRTLRNE
jgi:hypothetical protein